MTSDYCLTHESGMASLVLFGSRVGHKNRPAYHRCESVHTLKCASSHNPYCTGQCFASRSYWDDPVGPAALSERVAVDSEQKGQNKEHG